MLAIVLALVSVSKTATAGSIRTQVVDEDGAALLGVTAVVIPQVEGAQNAVITDEGGFAQFLDLPDGIYTLSFYFGESQVTRSNVVVAAGGTTATRITFDTRHAGTVCCLGCFGSPSIETTSGGLSQARDPGD